MRTGAEPSVTEEDRSFSHERKQTHYFDEKQLVCCQLDAEFTLLVKSAAGSDFIYFFSQTDFFVRPPPQTVLLQMFETAVQSARRKNKAKAGKSTRQME